MAPPAPTQPPAAPGYPPAGYGQFPPPVPPVPAPRKRGGTFALIALVVALMLGGGAAGYFLLGDSGGGEAAIDDGTSAAEEDEESGEPSEEGAAPEEEESEAPATGETMPVESLGAQIPVPSDQWELQFGPGDETAADINDAVGYIIQYEENWYATLQVGQYAVTGLPFDSADMAATATELARFWAEQSAASGTDGEYTDPAVTELTVDGHDAVLAESTATWGTSEYTSDTSETVIIFLVDVDGVNALYGSAHVPESAEGEYDPVIAAFEGTTFDE